MMPSDAAKILSVAAVYDRRTISELDAKAWADALDDLDPRDCQEAVKRHYRNSTDWCMPAHVRSLVTVVRRDRAAVANAERLQLEHRTAQEHWDHTRAHRHYLEATDQLAKKRAELEARRTAEQPDEQTGDAS